MQIQANLEKFEKSINSMSHELIYSKETTLYIYLCLLMRKLSLENAYTKRIGWDRLINAFSTDRIRAFYRALENMGDIEGLSFLSELINDRFKRKEDSKLEIILNAILPSVNEIISFDRGVIHALFKINSKVLRELSSEISGEFILNDFFFDLLFRMMDFKPGSSLYVFGPLDRNFIIETLYRNTNKDLNLYVQIENKMDYLITKILFYLLGADSTNITNEDFIRQPKVDDNGYELKKFDYVLSASLVPKQKINTKRVVMEDQYNRFSRSALVRARDFYHWAVIDTGLASLKETGTFFDFIPGGPLTSSTSANARRNLLEDRVQSKVFQFNSPSLFHMRFPVFLAAFEKSAEPARKIFMANFFEFYKDKHIEDLTSKQKKEIKEITVQNKELDNISRYVEINEMKENNMSLSPSSYIFEMPDMTPEEKKLFDTLDKTPNKCYLDEMAEIFKGRTLMKEDKRKARRNYTPVKLVKVKAIERNGTINWNNCERLQLIKKNIRKYANKFLKPGDILMPAIGSILRIGIIREIPKEGKQEQVVIADSNVIVIRVDQEKYSPALLFNIFSGPYGKYFIKKISRGLGTMMINTQVLNKVKIPVLEQEKQEQFQKNLTVINEEIQGYRQKISELEEKKETLLNQVIKEK